MLHVAMISTAVGYQAELGPGPHPCQAHFEPDPSSASCDHEPVSQVVAVGGRPAMPRAASAAPLGGDPGEAVRLGPPHRRRDYGRRPRHLARPAARPRYSPWSAWRPPSPTASAFTSDDPASAWPVFLGARVDAVGQRLHGRAAAPRPTRRRAARPPPTRTSRLTEADATGVVSGLPRWLAQRRGSLSSLNQSW